jgi:hypothetical protein
VSEPTNDGIAWYSIPLKRSPIKLVLFGSFGAKAVGSGDSASDARGE